jgi:hypothetical protein
MRLSVRAALALGVAFLTLSGNPAGAAVGGASLKFDDHVGTPTEGTYFIHNPFTVSVVVSSPDDAPNNRVQGVGYFFIANTSGAIQVNGRTLGPDYSDAAALTVPFTLNPGQSQNLGSSFPLTTSYRSAGDFLVADFSFTALTSGNFTITFDESKSSTEVYQPPTSSPGSDLNYASVGTYTIHALAPEPTSLSGIVLLMAGLSRRRRGRCLAA